MLRTSALAVVLALTVAGEERLVVRHAQDRTVTRKFERMLALELDSMTSRLDGEEMPGHGDVKQSTSESSELVVTDRVTALDDGRPSKLVRRFDTIATKRSMQLSNPMSGDVADESAESSELVGRTVEFERTDGEWTRSFAGEEQADTALLDGLVAELDLAEFLPADAVAPGAKWEIPAEAFARLSRPAGDLHLERDGEAKLPSTRLERGALAAQWSGEISAELRGESETAGERLLEIGLRVEVSAHTDLADAFRAANADRPNDPHSGAMSPEVVSALEDQTYTGEGRLVWNATQGRIQTLELECELARKQDMVFTIAFGGEERELSQLSSFTGKETFSIAFE
ncbi:MAG: hypothetical protein IT453_16415 [Planctomycetes bacterium]|nr:hypothetical protein [Planctomycetota bacterium]